MVVSTKRRAHVQEPSFCVVTRIFDAELPYVGSFIRHYISIGVSKFYFVNTHTAQFDEVQTYVAGLKVDGVEISIINTKDDNGKVNGMQNEALHDGMGDFVINVDVDEYWILPPSIKDLPTLVKKRPADAYHFGWLMVPFDDIKGTPKPPYRGFWGHQCKYMVRHSCLRRLGIHRPYLKGGGGKKKHVTCGIAVHSWGRGFKDCLLKVVGQKIGNSKTSSKEQLLHDVSDGDIPNRLKLLAYFCRQPRCVPLKTSKPKHTLLAIDEVKEEELLSRKIQPSEFDLAHKVYLSFARRLRSRKLWATLPRYGTGIGDLALVDHLEVIRATPVRATPSKRRTWDAAADTTPAKRPRTSSADSDMSTAAETPSDRSDSEQRSQVTPAKA